MKLKQISTSIILAAALLLNATISSASATSGTDTADTLIIAAVKAKLATVKDLPSGDIEVDTKDGIVYLKGVLATKQQVESALEAARSVANIKKVVATGLTVQTSESPITDTVITGKVKAKLMAFSNIHVETTNGVVNVSGTVKNQADIDKIVNTIKSVEGVKDVQQDITVE